MSKVKNGSISFLTFDILISGWPETNHINVIFCGDWLAGTPTTAYSFCGVGWRGRQPVLFEISFLSPILLQIGCEKKFDCLV